MGDFNKTIEDMADLQGRSAFVDYLLDQYWHDYGPTVKPTHAMDRDKGRQIDHIFSSTKLLNPEKITDPG